MKVLKEPLVTFKDKKVVIGTHGAVMTLIEEIEKELENYSNEKK